MPNSMTDQYLANNERYATGQAELSGPMGSIG